MEKGWVKRNKWIFVAGPLALVLIIWIGGEAVMLLWNWLLPVLFGVRTINLWQAIGLLCLARILFGRWSSGGNGHNKSDRPSGDKCKKLTPEERENFRAGTRLSSGGETLAGEPKEQE